MERMSTFKIDSEGERGGVGWNEMERGSEEGWKVVEQVGKGGRW